MCVCVSAGTCPGIFIMESMIDHVAKSLGLNPDNVRRANLYKKGQVLHTYTIHVTETLL